MNLTDSFTLKCQCGSPVFLEDICAIFPATLREIVEIGYDTFWQYIQVLTAQKPVIENKEDNISQSVDKNQQDIRKDVEYEDNGEVPEDGWEYVEYEDNGEVPEDGWEYVEYEDNGEVSEDGWEYVEYEDNGEGLADGWEYVETIDDNANIFYSDSYSQQAVPVEKISKNNRSKISLTNIPQIYDETKDDDLDDPYKK